MNQPKQLSVGADDYEAGRAYARDSDADQLAALLDETEEPKPLPLGHAFVPCDDADACLHGYSGRYRSWVRPATRGPRVTPLTE